MRIFTLLLILLFSCSLQAQDFSNKGTEFWTGFGSHERINGGGDCFMTLYFTSDEAAMVTIYVGTTLIQTLSLPANTITKSNDIPKTGATDARLLNEGVIAKRGINIKSTKPIVAYAQIWGSEITASTVLFPVATLGRTYTALNYTQISNCSSNFCKSYCFVVATEDNTLVQVKPSAATESGLTVGQFNTTTNQKILNKGDIWLIKGLNPTIDITGTQVRSISNSAGECKPIAFFSGSGKISITCSPDDASSDNLFQQAPPIVAWGRKYVTAPTATDATETVTNTYSYNVFRVMVNPDGPATTVKINGVTLPATVPNVGTTTTPIGAGTNAITLNNNLYYEFVSSQPLVIEATQPVMVAQYITNRTSCTNDANSNRGDPDMVYLSPVEQTLDKIIVAPVPSEANDAYNFLNVVMRTSDVANFTITDKNNAPVPFTFIPIPASIYSYAQITLAQGYSAVNSNYYKVSSTGAGFNAISYGYAQNESYAYNAGTNVKNLYQTLAINNDKVNKYGFGACAKTPTNIAIALNYKPTKLIWDFGGNPNISPNTIITQQALPEPTETIKAADSITLLYIYKLPQQYSFAVSDIYSLKVTGTNPNSDGCTDIEHKFDIIVTDGPTANFGFNFAGGCASDPIQFTDQSIPADPTVPITEWLWNYGDNAPDNVQNPLKLFNSGGTKNITLTAIDKAGCIGEKTQSIVIPPSPVSKFSIQGVQCVGSTLTFIDSSVALTPAGVTLVKWHWDFGDGTIRDLTASANQTFVYNTPGSYNITLKVSSVTGCESVVSNPVIVTISSLPDVSFEPDFRLCENKAVKFTDMSSPNVGTITEWHWDFGDGKTSTIKDPENIFAIAKTYPVKLWVKNSAGCESTKDLSIDVTIEPNPIANFTISNICFPDRTALFTDNTSPNGGASITEWTWDFGDNTIPSSGDQPIHLFASGGKYNVVMTAFAGSGCFNSITKPVEVMDAVSPVFNIDTSTNKTCSNQPVTLTANAIVNGYGTVKKVEIFWDYLNSPATSVVDNSPQTGKTYSYQYPQFGSPESKTVQVLFRAYSNNDCYRDSVMDLVLYAAPKALFAPLTALCQEDAAFALTEGSEQSGLAGTEIYSGNGITTSPEFSPLVAGPGTHTITYAFTSNGGCTSIATQNMVIDPTPELDYGGIRSLLEGDSARLNPVVATGNGLTYLWDKADYLSSTTIRNPVVRPLQDIVYTITATSTAGCVATNTLIVKLLKDFIVPNTFSPNNDGINDFWIIDQLKFYPEFKLMIFNRYGQLLYETSRYDKPWDGNYKGKSLPIGTYYYILELNGWRESKKGYVTILK